MQLLLRRPRAWGGARAHRPTGRLRPAAQRATYGNWAPNPAVELVHLLASLRDEEGHILIPGFYDDVRPLTAAEQGGLWPRWPPVEKGLEDELALGRTEGERGSSRRPG